MSHVELWFPVLGQPLPGDQGYSLYSAISTTLNDHLPRDVAVSWIRGPFSSSTRARLTRVSSLRIRTPIDHIGQLLPLAGKFLSVGGSEIGLGVPQIRQLQPSPSLKSHFVTIKGFTDPGPFLEAVGRQLCRLEITGNTSIPAVDNGPRKGEPRRRIIKIKGVTIVGYSLRVENLSDADSYRLQIAGIGGRRHMGCGIFVPLHERGDQP